MPVAHVHASEGLEARGDAVVGRELGNSGMKRSRTVVCTALIECADFTADVIANESRFYTMLPQRVLGNGRHRASMLRTGQSVEWSSRPYLSRLKSAHFLVPAKLVSPGC